jgi:ER lumen protein retaining receptor
MKLFFIGTSMYIVYMMRYKRPFCITYDKVADEFPHFMVILPTALVLTCIVHSGWEPWEFMWSFSLWLESLAFIPQIIMLSKVKMIENITSHYMACLGLYRFFYIINW